MFYDPAILQEEIKAAQGYERVSQVLNAQFISDQWGSNFVSEEPGNKVEFAQKVCVTVKELLSHVSCRCVRLKGNPKTTLKPESSNMSALRQGRSLGCALEIQMIV
ncbi:hypothetical protein PoB_005903300 [Plakobranchus ocellatus]|uniref:Uncharacterized protein n=1 Tax=Plakobranchus ocellatus TaxID=259542 RepID=A0AAV4CKJ2_9GAST|nr:hypothetical protein PoB_005903300 [Plakobranchus ocellatus]